MSSRQKKYPNTDTFEYYNTNPKGKLTTDCVARAISTALEQTWEYTVIDLAQFAIETGYDTHDPKGYGKYLESKGWTKQKQPRKANNNKYTGKEFCKIFKGTCVANIGGGHVVCVRDGKVFDTWDSTEYTIGNYWTQSGL